MLDRLALASGSPVSLSPVSQSSTSQSSERFAAAWRLRTT
jgi:hypothetical protein